MFRLKEKLKLYKKIIRSLTSLSVLQAANYLFPLIILPYVVRILEPEKYGLVQFAAALNIYFLIICDYGFNLSGTKAVSVHREEKEKLSQIFSSILLIKTALFIVAIILLAAIVFSIEKFRADYLVYFASSGMLIGSVLFPLWLFQGLEKMKYITIIHVIVRTLTTALIFLLIRTEADYITLALLNSLTQVLIGVGGIITALTILKVKFIFPPLKIIKEQLHDGWYLFLSSISINFYTTSNTFILGILTNNTFVGYYAAADKIRMAFQGVQSIWAQTVFPHINKLLNESYDKFITFNKNLLKYQTQVLFLISLILFLFAEKIVLLLLGQQFSESIFVLKILAILPFLSSFTTIFAVNMLVPLDQKNDFMKTFLAAGIIGLISALVLIPLYKQNGAAIAIVLAEVTAASLSFWYVKRKLKISG